MCKSMEQLRSCAAPKDVQMEPLEEKCAKSMGQRFRSRFAAVRNEKAKPDKPRNV
jgi:hypothetical protein